MPSPFRSRTPRTDRFEAAAFHGNCPRCGHPSPSPFEPDPEGASPPPPPKRCPDCGLTHATQRRFTYAYGHNTKLQQRHRSSLGFISSLLLAIAIVSSIGSLLVMLITRATDQWDLSLLAFPLIALGFLIIALILAMWFIGLPIVLCLCLRVFKHDRADRVLFGRELTLARWCTYAAIVFFPAVLGASIYGFSISGLVANVPVFVLTIITGLALLALPVFIARRLTVLAARVGAFDHARKTERFVRTIAVGYVAIAIPLILQGIITAFPTAPGIGAIAALPRTLLAMAAFIAAIVLLIGTLTMLNRTRSVLDPETFA
ncbi:MAG: hypothetical protein EA378_10675 [Phycisphaerales bacterium]|nr:MAG: hypothetical protein EA378_10675 [Phycisphaerales bacterium]